MGIAIILALFYIVLYLASGVAMSLVPAITMTLVSVILIINRKCGRKIQELTLLISACALLGIYAGTWTVTAYIAKQHGAETEYVKTIINPVSMMSQIHDSPKMNDIDILELESGDIIAYFRYGCEDCEMLYSRYKDQLNSIKSLYWISTRASNGRKMLEHYPVNEVPMFVMVEDNGIFTVFDPFEEPDNDGFIIKMLEHRQELSE